MVKGKKEYFLSRFLMIAILVGFVLRIYSLSSMDFYFDEAVYARFAKDFVENGVSPWQSSAVQPPLFTWINSIPVYFLGATEFSLRIPSVILGVLSILLIYYLAKLWFGEKNALLAAFLTAITPLHVIYSRLAFNDLLQSVFVVTSIIFAEIALARPVKKNAFFALSGMMFGLSYLVKYNSLLIIGLYWLFNVIYISREGIPGFKKAARHLAVFASSSVILVFTVISLTGGFEHLVFLVNSTIFWTSFQYLQSNNPFYYYFAVLFDSLSPVAFALLPVSMIYFVSRKKTRQNAIHLFLVLFYLIMISVQARRYSRYLLMILPFIIILVSNFSIIVFDYLKKSKKKLFAHLFLAILLLSSLSWTAYEINKDLHFNVWSKAGEYIRENYPDAVAHASFHKSRLSSYYIKQTPPNSEFISTLKKKDLVVFTWLSNDTSIAANSPFEDESFFLDIKRSEYDKDFIEYVMAHGKLVKTFYYKDAHALWIYEISSTGPHKEDKEKPEQLQASTLFGLWHYICGKWAYDSFLKRSMKKILSEQQSKAVYVKCETKSYIAPR